MLHARLREIRKAKGLTLEQVAARVPPSGTTAQTIGRLETGMRNLTLDWIDRIAMALDVDPSEILALPGGGDVLVTGEVDSTGLVKRGDFGVVSLRLSGTDPLSLLIAANLGQYRAGDRVLFHPLAPEEYGRGIGLDCLVEDDRERRYFTKLAPWHEAGTFALLPLASQGPVFEGVRPTLVAPATALIRSLG